MPAPASSPSAVPTSHDHVLRLSPPVDELLDGRGVVGLHRVVHGDDALELVDLDRRDLDHGFGRYA